MLWINNENELDENFNHLNHIENKSRLRIHLEKTVIKKYQKPRCKFYKLEM